MKINELKKIARLQLVDKWKTVLLICLMILAIDAILYYVTPDSSGIMYLFPYLISIIIAIFFTPIFLTGERWVYLDIYHRQEITATTPFQLFTKEHYVRVLLTNLLTGVYISSDFYFLSFQEL